MSSPKYNRTPHLPWSSGTKDDKVADDVSSLLGRTIIVTEKLDGSNTSLEKHGCFARTHAGPPTHESFDGLKALHAGLKYQLIDDVQYFGEWCYAKHSIQYSQLPGYFMLFAIRFLEDNHWADWDVIEDEAVRLNVSTVPFLWRGSVKSEAELKDLTLDFASRKSSCGGDREGVVVRIADGFRDEDFSTSVMKFVRKNHVQTDSHWKEQEIIRNKLK